jgi:hypothetical protein
MGQGGGLGVLHADPRASREQCAALPDLVVEIEEALVLGEAHAQHGFHLGPELVRDEILVVAVGCV